MSSSAKLGFGAVKPNVYLVFGENFQRRGKRWASFHSAQPTVLMDGPLRDASAASKLRNLGSFFAQSKRE